MRLFKYRGGAFQRDLDSLQEDYFWAPTRDQLNDPCEGLFDKDPMHKELGLINMLFGNGSSKTLDAFGNVKSAVENVFGFVDRSGIYSLSKTPLDELLWAHYSASHTGFCIEYDLDLLTSYEEQDYQIIEVQYLSGPLAASFNNLGPEGSSSLLKVMFGVKSRVWSYENEVRLVSSFSGRHNYDYRALKAIYFGLRIPNDQRLNIMEALQGRGVDYYQMQLKEKSYDFNYTPVVDPFADAPRYKYRISPIAKDAIAPKHVSDKYKNYVEYLYKAAEIVRREPDCNEIEYVEFSSSKGSENNPVIFVQYKRSEIWITRHLDLHQIDEFYSKIGDLEKMKFDLD